MKKTDKSQETSRPFIKFHSRLSWIFEPGEIIFICHMLELEYIRSKGGKSVYCKRELMEKMNMGERVFERCVRRMEKLGLLRRVPQGNMYEYLWAEEVYERLLDMLYHGDSRPYRSRLKSFLKDRLLIQEETISSLSLKEIENLEERSI